MRVRAKQFNESIRHHMERVHVSTSSANVETEIRTAIAKFQVTNPEWEFTERTKLAIVRYALKCHEENRDLYVYVMSGRMR